MSAPDFVTKKLYLHISSMYGGKGEDDAKRLALFYLDRIEILGITWCKSKIILVYFRRWFLCR